MNVPWCESIYFKDELEKRPLSPEQKEWARSYHDSGILIIKQACDPDLIDQTVAQIQELHGAAYQRKNGRRIQDLWKNEDEAGRLVKQIATNAKVMEALEMLYGREAYPFQTLNFKWGSEQRAHSDCIHFSSLPERYMSGVWVALEDASEENGTIFYYPGSHKLPVYNLQHIISRLDEVQADQATDAYVKYYEPFIEDLMHAHGLEKKTLPIQKGDAVIWAANLVHGGGPIGNEDRTRWSQVTHYYYKDCLYYTPLLSNPAVGDYQLNFLQDIKTGEPIAQTYNGQSVPVRPMEDNLYNISKRVSQKLGKFDFISNNAVYRSLSKFKKR